MAWPGGSFQGEVLYPTWILLNHTIVSGCGRSIVIYKQRVCSYACVDRYVHVCVCVFKDEAWKTHCGHKFTLVIPTASFVHDVHDAEGMTPGMEESYRTWIHEVGGYQVERLGHDRFAGTEVGELASQGDFCLSAEPRKEGKEGAVVKQAWKKPCTTLISG